MEYFYLDIGPMIRRLQQHPDEFEISPNCIRHRPSRRRLAFERDSNGRIVARCNRSALPVSREQGMALRVAISNWEGFSRRPSIAARRPLARAGCVKSVMMRYFMLETRWRRKIKALRAWFASNFLQRRRRVSRPNLRIVSSRADGALARADTSGAASQQREQRLSGRRPIAAIGQSTSSTTTPPAAAPMTKEVMR